MLGCSGLWQFDFPSCLVLTSNILILIRSMTFISKDLFNTSLIDLQDNMLSKPSPGPASNDGDGQT